MVEEIQEQRNNQRRYHHRRTTAHFSMPDLTRDTGSATPPDSPIKDVPDEQSNTGTSSGTVSSKKLIVRFSPSTAKLPPSSEDEEQKTLSQKVERSSSSSCAGSEETYAKNKIPIPSSIKRNSGVLRSRSYGDTSELETHYEQGQSTTVYSYRQHDDDRCSTCSSSSSEDDPYELPPRRAYGGVRISYVSNDALAVARQRSGTLQSSGAKSLRRRRKHDDKNCIVS